MVKYEKSEVVEAVEKAVKELAIRELVNYFSKIYYEFKLEDDKLIPNFYIHQCGVNYSDEDYRRNGVALVVYEDEYIIIDEDVDDEVAEEIREIVEKSIEVAKENIAEERICCEKCYEFYYTFDENHEEFVERNDHSVFCKKCYDEKN